MTSAILFAIRSALGTVLTTSMLVIMALPLNAQEQPAISCTYDDNMASTRCDTGPDPVAIHAITINDGKCKVWNHRLVRSELDAKLRASGEITTCGDYSDADIRKLSAAVLEGITSAEIPALSFFRFDAYRCGIQKIELDTSVGIITLKAHH